MNFFKGLYRIWTSDLSGKFAVLFILLLMGLVVAVFTVALKDNLRARHYIKRCESVCQSDEYPSLPTGADSIPLKECYCEKDITQITKR